MMFSLLKDKEFKKVLTKIEIFVFIFVEKMVKYTGSKELMTKNL